MNENPIDSPSQLQPVKLRTQTSKIGLVLLAAGESRRLEGFPKQLLKLGDKTLLRFSAEIALASLCHRVCVVLGAKSGEIEKKIKDLPLEIVVNENWANGMSSSLQTGLKRLLEIDSSLSGVVIMLCDQPLITSRIINKLIEIFAKTETRIVACEYDETIGVPALFANSLFEELLNLSAASGAKQIIKKYLSSIEKVSVPEAAVDIDTRKDFEQLKKLKKTW